MPRRRDDARRDRRRGKPSILVPLPTATDDHQRKNAEVLAKAGAAEVIEQRDLTGDRLAVMIFALAADPDGRGACRTRRGRWHGPTPRG